MSINLPQKAMVLAAGMGTRMRPLTDTIPKALVEVDGKTLIDHTLDHLAAAGVAEAMVNHHYRGQQLLDHLGTRQGGPALSFSDESGELLETGGGVLKALPFFGADPFITVNSDAIWTNDEGNALQRLADAFDPDTMDVLLLLVPREQAVGHPGAGDFFIHSDASSPTPTRGPLIWRGDAANAPYIYGGVHISQPSLYQDCPTGAFSLVTLWKRASAAGRLFGLVHKGLWHDVGSPQGRIEAERLLQSART
jgi:N-acetyl-alpha-D-muramate 1-phosphate uridylyltransferase